LEQLLELSEPELNQNPCPYLTTRGWVKEKYFEWGPGHPLWESRVLGNFPSADPYGLIPLAWVELARIREPIPSTAEIEAGVDVAEGGENETVACVRRGAHVIAAKGWSERDARGPVAEFLKRHGVQKVKVDKIGVGSYFETHLRDLGLEVLGVNVCEAPSDRERFANLKAELYWGLRERFETGEISGTFSERTISQLTAIRYELTPKGQIAIEAKEKMERRGVKSPDWAEALMLAFAPMQIEAEWPPIISLTRECPWRI
jgi:phage terminase large subunit